MKKEDHSGSKGLKFYSGKLLTGTMAVSLAQGTQKAVGFLLLPILTFYLSPSEYGIIAIVGLISSLLNLIYNPGVVSATTRLYYDTEDEERKRKLFASAFMFFILFPLVISVIIFIFGEYLASHLFKEFKFYPYGFIAILISLLSQPRRIWSQLLTVLFKVPKIALYSTLAVLVNICLSLVLVVGFNFGVIGRLFGMLAGPVMMLIIAIFTFRKYTGLSFSFKIIFELVSFGSPLIIAIWCYTILTMTSRFLLERFIGLDAVGIFDVAMKVSSASMLLFMGFKQMWNPVFYENMKNENYEVISRLIKFMFAGMTILTILMILFHKEGLLILNERFRSSGEIVTILVTGLFFLGLLPVSNSFLGWEKKFKTTSLIAGIAAVINIILNILLIPKYDIIGAAIATAISYFVYFILGIFISRRFFKTVLDLKVSVFLISLVVITGFLETTFQSDDFNVVLLLIKVSYLLIIITLVYKMGIISNSELVKLKQRVFRKQSKV